MEIWKQVPGFGGCYEASSLGRIRSRQRTVEKRTRWGGMMIQEYKAAILNPWETRGYQRVSLGWDGNRAKVFVHHMVLLAFHGGRAGAHGRHLDGDRANNRPKNLAWGSAEDNACDRKRHGRYASGRSHPMAKFSEETVEKIRSGAMTHKEAKLRGVSTTQFYRLRKT